MRKLLFLALTLLTVMSATLTLPRLADAACSWQCGECGAYHLTFTATDPQGASCTGTATVCVPHDRGKRSTCGDGGALFDSTGSR